VESASFSAKNLYVLSMFELDNKCKIVEKLVEIKRMCFTGAKFCSGVRYCCWRHYHAAFGLCRMRFC